MNTRKLHQWEHNLALSCEELVHKEEFWGIVIAALVVLGLILAAIFIPKSATGEPFPEPFYPYLFR